MWKLIKILLINLDKQDFYSNKTKKGVSMGS